MGGWVSVSSLSLMFRVGVDLSDGGGPSVVLSTQLMQDSAAIQHVCWSKYMVLRTELRGKAGAAAINPRPSTCQSYLQSRVAVCWAVCGHGLLTDC
jgi:hypothetical protein